MNRLQRLLSRLRSPFRKRSLGEQGEAAAAGYLRGLGYRIVGRGVRTKLGEIDLVAVDGRTVVFVEVKTRRSDQQGRPSEAVDTGKQRRLTRLATAYLKRRRLLHCAARFDIVAVTWPDRGRPRIEHFRNAFEAAD